MTVSVIIITKNEAGHIGRCLASVAWADEIIVLDSGSSDATVDICRQYTPHVFSTDWPGFGPQKQRALSRASHDWVLSIDADETVTAALKAEILAAMHRGDAQGFEIPRLSSYCGRQIRHSGWWPDRVLRLFRRQAGSFSSDVVHERVMVSGPVARLQQPLLHEAFVDPEEVLRKIDAYSTLGAEKMSAAGQRAGLGTALLKGFWTFIKTYLLKAGFLDGPEGLMLAISNAEGSYYKYLKLRSLQRQGSDDHGPGGHGG